MHASKPVAPLEGDSYFCQATNTVKIFSDGKWLDVQSSTYDHNVKKGDLVVYREKIFEVEHANVIFDKIKLKGLNGNVNFLNVYKATPMDVAKAKLNGNI